MRDQEPEKSLFECEELSRAILENSPECLGLLDTTGRFLMINETGLRLLGADSVDAAYGTEWRLLWPERARPQLDVAMSSAKSGGKARFREWCPTTKGELRLWDVTVTPLRDHSGRLTRFLTASRDITDIKRMEDELRWSARCNALTSEAAGQLLKSDNPRAVVDELCRMVMSQLDCQFFFNFLFEEHTDCLRLNAFAGVSEEEAHKFERLEYGRALRGCAVRNCESESACTARDLRTELIGSHGVTAYCCHPLITEGRVIGTLAFGSRTRSAFNDSEIDLMETLSHFVSMAIARAQMDRALRESDRRKDEFIATLAHELRNPLAAIRNGFNVLNQTGGAAMPRLRPMMDRQLDQLVRLVDDLLEVSRIKTGKIELKKQRIDLASVIDQAVEMNRDLIEASGLELCVALSDEPLFVEADAVRLTQVFANLLNNAAKYTDPGGRIEITVQRGADGAVVSVTDTGVGIAKDMLPRVFDIFAQAGDIHARSKGGLGIGLALTRGLVALHEGTVEAHSEGEGRGASLIVRLPLSANVEAGARPSKAMAARARAPRHVLIVDDVPDVADSLALLLETLGANVRVARSGAEGLALFAEFAPELVLLDIGMPGMDGIETARRMRELPTGRKATLVALTGWGEAETRKRVKEAGFDRHITKPADMGELEALLDCGPQEQRS